jgi:hypothetical protein
MDPHVPIEAIEKKIFLVRGKKVMLDADLAELYGVETFNLNRASNGILNDFLQISCFN